MPQEEGESDSPAMRLMKERLGKFETEEGRLKGLAFVPVPADVLISTTPKAGTTFQFN